MTDIKNSLDYCGRLNGGPKLFLGLIDKGLI